jgi:hypothetical protein
MGYTLQYYDVVLVGIVSALGVGGAVGALTPVAMPVAVVALGGVAIGIMGRALFVNGPVDGVDDLAEEIEEGSVTAEELPPVE